MNAPIARLFVVIVAMFGLLIAFTSRWTVFQASALNNNSLNERIRADDVRIKRGKIFADDGTVLAESKPAGGGTWKRVYPQGSLFAQAIGYSNVGLGEYTGLEDSDQSDLRGNNRGLSTVFGQVSGTQVGNDVHTTLDPVGQKAARAALAGRPGAVVALNPKTGAVLVMYANPGYNDNHVCNAGCGSLFNNATQAKDPPGSTFKVVTAVAAIDSGEYTPDSLIDGSSPIKVSGVSLSNDDGENYGHITLTQALTDSVNTVFAQVAEHVGIPTMTKYMERFGFYAKPPIDLPPLQLRASGVSTQDPQQPGRFFRPGSPDEDIGRIGIGQGGLLVTPLQMAEVVSAVADGGRLMAPHLTTRVVDPTGQVVRTVGPTLYHTVMKPSTAADLTAMMKKVVEEGTLQSADLGNDAAGKTGTAEVGNFGSNITEPWVVAFAPSSDPQVAIAVTVQQTDGGYGATVAGPIARQVMQALISEGK